MTADYPFPFGKFKGTPMKDVPKSYLLAFYNKDNCFGGLRKYLIENLYLWRHPNPDFPLKPIYKKRQKKKI